MSREPTNRLCEPIARHPETKSIGADRYRMGLISTVTDALAGSTETAPGVAGDDGSEGSYWCDDCGVRVRDVDVDDEGLDRDDEGVPACPDCGDAMRFERATGHGCAC